MIKFIGSMTVLLSACAAALAAEPLDVPVRELEARSEELLGRVVVTHGCLISHMHGGFIEPCGSKDWRAITLAYDKDNIVRKALRKKNPKRVWLGYEVEGTFTGNFVKADKTGKLYFEVTSFDSLQVHEP